MTVTLPPGRGVPIWGCAALCAAATTIGGLRVLDELAWQVSGGRAALTLTAVAGGAGVLLGLWLPRRVLRRWRAPPTATAASAGSRGAVPPGPVTMDFAALVVGSLAVAAAVLWMLLSLGATFAEDWRAWLAARFLFAPELKRALVVGPVALLSSALALTATLLLLGLHGWQRLARPRERGWAAFWGAVAAGTGVGGLVAGYSAAPPVSDVLTVVLTLGGGVWAVGRTRPGEGIPESEVEHAPRSVGVVRALAAPVAAAGALGALLAGALPTETFGVAAVGSRLGFLAFGCLFGIAVLATPPICGMAVWVPLGAAAVLAAGNFGRWPGADALCSFAACAALAVTLRAAAERTVGEVRRSQAALAVVSSAMVLGGVVGLVAAPPTPARALALAGVLVVGAAWAHSPADAGEGRPRRRVRLALTAVVLVLLVPGLARPPAREGGESDTPGILPRLAAAAGGDRAVLVLASAEALRDADLAGPRADVVIADATRMDTASRGAVSRLTARLQVALRPGGALVLVGRTAGSPGLPASADPKSPPARMRAYRTAAGEEIVVVGGALPARLAAVLEAEARD